MLQILVRVTKARQSIRKLLLSFEHTLGCHLCIYDYSDLLADVLPAEHRVHRQACCRRVIASGRACGRFCHLWECPAALRRWRGAGLKQCPAGILEYVVPIWDGDDLLGTVLAGQFQVPGPDTMLPVLLADENWSLDRQALRLREQLPVLDGDRLQHLQLQLPLVVMHLQGLYQNLIEQQGAQKDRRAQIQYWLCRRYAKDVQLEDLAQELYLSASRTRHVLQELFGMGFSQFVRQYRLERAKELLLNTALSIADVANSVGILDAGYFHRCFKNHTGHSPTVYRCKQSSSSLPV